LALPTELALPTALAWWPLDWLSRPASSLGRLGPERQRPGRSGPLSQRLTGLSGSNPLIWWAAGSYGGLVRQALLRLRDDPRPAALAPWLTALVPLLQADLARANGALPARLILMPIPSWKRRANPLPPLIAREMSLLIGAELNSGVLTRSRPVLGQHHLGRQMRLANQQGAFTARPAPAHQIGPRPPVLLIDDILTTGATACAAAHALRSAGWRVAGLACLARTPARRPTATQSLGEGSGRAVI